VRQVSRACILANRNCTLPSLKDSERGCRIRTGKKGAERTFGGKGSGKNLQKRPVLRRKTKGLCKRGLEGTGKKTGGGALEEHRRAARGGSYQVDLAAVAPKVSGVVAERPSKGGTMFF